MNHQILTAVLEGIGTITFNNPQRHNAMSLDMWRGALQGLATMAEDRSVRVIILTGAGGKAFVSGADISKFEQERASADTVETYNAAVDAFQTALTNCNKPTIAMIRGYCIGGGVGIAACCDLRICSEGSRFAIPAAKLGLGYGVVNIRRVMELVGPQFVAELLFTARQFDAQEARIMRLVNAVVPDTAVEAHVTELAQRIAANAPLTIRASKAIIRDLLRDEADRDPVKCDALVRACFESQDYQEGRRAFMEKRKPVFRGQ